MSGARGSVESVFEDVSEVDLIEVMGEASRDESTAIAQRLLAVGVLYARRAVQLAETFWWRSDPTEEVAAEISAAQNISHARAVGQIHYGRTLCDDPAGVRIPAEHEQGRYVDISPGASAGMAFVSGHIHATDAAALDQRLDALAGSVCENDPRCHTAPMPAGR